MVTGERICQRGRRVELLAGLARTMPQDDRRSRAHANTAVVLARRLGDPRAMTIALATWVLVTWGPDDTAQRLAAIDEVISLADGLAWVDVVVEARNWRAATLLQLGRDVESEADTAALQDWAARSGRPFFVALAAMRQIGTLLAEGQLAEAEQALAIQREIGHRLGAARTTEVLAKVRACLREGTPWSIPDYSGGSS